MQTYLLFYIIAGLLLFVEAFTPGTFLFICFAIATAFVGVLDHCFDLSLEILLGIGLVSSLILLFTVRPFLKLVLKMPSQKDPSHYGSYPERLIGKEAMVFKAISSHEPGLVKLYDFDETWLAKSQSAIGQGATVKILSIDGNQLIVEPVSGV